jgi:hypothetical protein
LRSNKKDSNLLENHDNDDEEEEEAEAEKNMVDKFFT